MRFPKPYFRSSRKTWCVQVGKRQIGLGADKNEAFKRYRELLVHDLGEAPEPNRRLNVAQVCDVFLEHARTNTDSYDWYKGFLQSFCSLHGTLEVVRLKPLHVTGWLKSKKWGPTTRNRAIGCLQTALNHAVKQGYIRENPVRHCEKPPAERREKLMTDDERGRMYAGIPDAPFRMFFFALWRTGARPGEVRKVEAGHVNLDAGVWVFPPRRHKTGKKTGRPRVIVLTPPMVKLTRLLMARHPSGPLFRNTDGNPWTKSAVRLRFCRLRKRLGLDDRIVAYLLRHGFCTDALERGVPIATVAELLGHTTTNTIAKHYSHLTEKTEHLRLAALQATRRMP